MNAPRAHAAGIGAGLLVVAAAAIALAGTPASPKSLMASCLSCFRVQAEISSERASKFSMRERDLLKRGSSISSSRPMTLHRDCHMRGVIAQM